MDDIYKMAFIYRHRLRVSRFYKRSERSKLRRHAKSCYPFLWLTKNHKLQQNRTTALRHQELQHLVSHTTAIRAIFHGLNQKQLKSRKIKLVNHSKIG